MGPLIKVEKNKLDKINYLSEINEYLVIREDGEIFLVPAVCKHEYSKLPKVSKLSSCITCSRHGWILDIERGEYINPAGLKQMESKYSIKIKDEIIEIYSNFKSLNKWPDNPVEDLELNEAKINFINHACIFLDFQGISICTDPWLLGPSFVTGWFLNYSTSYADIEKVLKVNYVFISHSHPDHLNALTLLFLKEKNWDPIFIVPNFSRADITYIALKNLGFNKIVRLDKNTDYFLDTNNKISIRILLDKSGRNDSAILISYKGHKILNTVDCPSPDIDGLKDIDLALIEAADGASAYPVCWEDLYGIDRINLIKKGNNRRAIETMIQRVKKLNSEFVIPFAGYFSIPLIEDSIIKSLNTFNSVEKIITETQKSGANFKTINPLSNFYGQLKNGFTAEMSDKKVYSDSSKLIPDIRNLIYERYCNFDKDELIEFLNCQEYKDKLIVNFNVFDINFENLKWILRWDFSSNKEILINESFPDKTDLKILTINIRNYALGFTIRNSLPFEEFSIGFQARFYRTPNTYNFGFWDYFQNEFKTVKPVLGDIIDFYKESSKLRENLNNLDWFS